MRIIVAEGFELSVDDLPEEVLGAVEELCASCTHKNPARAKLEAMNFWPGKEPRFITSYRLDDGRLVLPRGAGRRLRKILAGYGEAPRFLDARTRAPLEKSVRFQGELRPYQTQIVEALAQKENLLVRSAAGSGKTVAGLAAFARLGERALVVVWNSFLLEQWRREAKRFLDLDAGEVGVFDARWKRPGLLTIGMQQTLRNYVDQIRGMFGLLICDEVQRFAAPTFEAVVAKIPARYRLGLSEDESRKDRKEFLIYDHFGEPFEAVAAEELIDEGSVLPVLVRVVPTGWAIRDKNDQVIPVRNLHPARVSELTSTSEARNDFIFDWIYEVMQARHTALVFAERRLHCQYWVERLARAGIRTGLLLGHAGSVSEKKRFERDASALGDGRLDACAGTNFIYQSLNVPRLDVGFATTRTAANKQLFSQQLGRLRRPLSGEEKEAVLYYFWDQEMYPWDLNHLRRALNERDALEVWDAGAEVWRESD